MTQTAKISKIWLAERYSRMFESLRREMGTSKRMSSNGYFNIHKRSNCKQTHKFHNVGSFDSMVDEELNFQDLVCQQSFNTFFSNFHCIQFKTLNLCGSCRKTFLSGGSFNFHLLFHHEFCNQVSTARRESSFLFSSFLREIRILSLFVPTSG